MAAELLVLVGAPGSGKSTYAGALDGYRIISAEGIREAITGDRDDMSQEEEVWEYVIMGAEASLRAGENVVVDAPNTTRDERARLVELAEEHGAKATCVVFWMDEASCLTNLRNRARKDSGRVDSMEEDRVRQMVRNLERWPPRPDEGFAEVTEKGRRTGAK